MYRIVASSLLLYVVLSEVLPTLALPAVRTSLQKSKENGIEDDEPLHAYVYEYEDDSDQLWSDCSELDSIISYYHSVSIYANMYHTNYR